MFYGFLITAEKIPAKFETDSCVSEIPSDKVGILSGMISVTNESSTISCDGFTSLTVSNTDESVIDAIAIPTSSPTIHMATFIAR